jgi:3-oxocholest-4-en-26-oyl-CoA dehydrogenase alpha subunit
MNFRFSKQDEAFLGEVRAFIQNELPEDWDQKEGLVDYEGPEGVAFAQSFRQKLGERGWLSLGWPREYGGAARSVWEPLVIEQELTYWGLPSGGQPVHQWGPIIMTHGSPEQKAHFLPGIASARWVWAEGYSEPDGGSDLGGLKTQAIRDGDEYVINGSKIWNGAHAGADYFMLLARTNPEAVRHRGLSYLIVDMKTPGVSVREVPMMWGHSRGLVHFEDARVPLTSRVGDEGQGFYVAMGSLNVQRAGIERYAIVKRIQDLLVEYAMETSYGGQRVIDRPGIRNQLAEVIIAAEAYRLMMYKVAWLQGQGLDTARESATCKILGPATNQKTFRLAMQMMGPYATLEPHSKWAPLYGRLQTGYLDSFARTIGSGTSEINRNVLAQRVLGLPR